MLLSTMLITVWVQHDKVWTIRPHPNVARSYRQMFSEILYALRLAKLNSISERDSIHLYLKKNEVDVARFEVRTALFLKTFVL
jgi:hypothetical protein